MDDWQMSDRSSATHALATIMLKIPEDVRALIVSEAANVAGLACHAHLESELPVNTGVADAEHIMAVALEHHIKETVA